jgi:hypothetical protein
MHARVKLGIEVVVLEETLVSIVPESGVIDKGLDTINSDSVEIARGFYKNRQGIL